MYKKLERALITLSIVLVSAFSMIIVINKHKQMFAGTNGGVLVLKAKSNIKESIAEIAKKNNVLIAKQIMVPSTDGKTDNQPTFQKFGNGTLPKDFPEQKNKEFIEDSNDSVYYFIFGKTLSSIDLSKYLNEKGNTSMVSDNDWRFQGITALLDTRMIVGLLLFLISYTSILMANIIINLKKQGVQRLAGISCFRLSFLGLKKRLTYIFITTIITLLTSSLILYIINLRRIMYFYVIIFPTIFIVLVLLLIELIVGILVYLFLQRQKINLVIKDMAPIRALMSFVFLLQLISLLCLIFSFSSISSSYKDLVLLKKATNKWKSQDYYSPSLLNGNTDKSKENVLRFLSEANQKEEVLIIADNFNKYPLQNQYFPTSNGNENILYVTPNYLKKVGIKFNNTMKSDITILVPETEKSHKNKLSTLWSQAFNSLNETSFSYNSSVYKSPSKDLFTFRIFGWSAVDNQAFVQEPLIVVMSPKLFNINNKNINSDVLFSWFSREQILFSNNKTTADLIKKYRLENVLGSFSNGNLSVKNRFVEIKSQQLFIVVTSSIALISSTFLFYLMNKIYLYQNRKKFAVARISGESLFTTHKTYLIQLFIIIIFAIGMIFIWHLNPLTLIIPPILGGLQLILLTRQIKNNKTFNISVLKGE